MTLDGQGGDEVIGGYPQQLSPFLTQLVRSGRVREWARETRAFGGDASLGAFARTTLRGRSLVASRRGTTPAPAGEGAAPLPRLAERTREGRTALRLDARDDRPARQVRGADAPRPHRRPPRAAALLRQELDGALDRGAPAVPRPPARRALPVAAAGDAHRERRVRRRCCANALRDRIPPEVLARRDKIGFATPESSWLRDLIPEVLSSRVVRAARLRQAGAPRAAAGSARARRHRRDGCAMALREPRAVAAALRRRAALRAGSARSAAACLTSRPALLVVSPDVGLDTIGGERLRKLTAAFDERGLAADRDHAARRATTSRRTRRWPRLARRASDVRRSTRGRSRCA